MFTKSQTNLDKHEQFWVLFTWQQRFESFAPGFLTTRCPAKLKKKCEPSNPDSQIRLTTKLKKVYKTTVN
jgi:hypothetical protein